MMTPTDDLHRHPLPDAFGRDVRELDALMTELADRAEIPNGLSARVFFASAPLLRRTGGGVARRRLAAAGWLALAASVAAAFSLLLRPAPTPGGPDGLSEAMIVDAGLLAPSGWAPDDGQLIELVDDFRLVQRLLEFSAEDLSIKSDVPVAHLGSDDVDWQGM